MCNVKCEVWRVKWEVGREVGVPVEPYLHLTLTRFPMGVPVEHHPLTRQSSLAISAASDAALKTICASSSTTRHHCTCGERREADEER